MRFRGVIRSLLFASVMLAGLAQASPDARQVLEASSIADMVAQYPEMMSQGVQDGLRQSGQVPAMVTDSIGFVVRSMVSAATIERQLVADLDAGLSDQQLQAVYDWYQTPVAQKISEAEVAASAPAAWAEVRRQAQALNEQHRGTPRARLFSRFDSASRATESVVDTAIAVQLGLGSALAALSQDSVRHESLRDQLEAQRPALRAMVEQQVYDSYLYTYQDLSLQELQLYLEFLESGAGQEFTRVVTDSLQRSITEPLDSIGARLTGLMNFGRQ